jgi:hypothetical protein
MELPSDRGHHATAASFHRQVLMRCVVPRTQAGEMSQRGRGQTIVINGTAPLHLLLRSPVTPKGTLPIVEQTTTPAPDVGRRGQVSDEVTCCGLGLDRAVFSQGRDTDLFEAGNGVAGRPPRWSAECSQDCGAGSGFVRLQRSRGRSQFERPCCPRVRQGCRHTERRS